MIPVTRGEDICALECLLKEAENVHDDHNGLVGVLGAGHVCVLSATASLGLVVSQLDELTGLVAADIYIGAFGLVALADDGRNVAARLAVSVRSFHGRHVACD